jgi:hypothetical protein
VISFTRRYVSALIRVFRGSWKAGDRAIAPDRSDIPGGGQRREWVRRAFNHETLEIHEKRPIQNSIILGKVGLRWTYVFGFLFVVFVCFVVNELSVRWEVCVRNS